MSHVKAALVTVCSALLLQACTTLGPDYEEPPVEWLQDWQTDLYGQYEPANAAQADLDFWWMAFNDPVLTGLIETAKRENPGIRIAALAIVQSRALLGVAILASSAYAGTHVGLENTSIKQKVPKRWSIPILQPQRKDEEPEYRYIPLTKFTQTHHYRASALNFACLGIFLVGITMGVSACDRYRWRTIGIVVAFYVLQTVIELTGMSVEGGRWMLNFTFFAAYEPVAFATLSSQDPSAVWDLFASESHGRIPDLGPLGCDLVLVGLGLVGFVSAFFVFLRRDLPAPL